MDEIREVFQLLGPRTDSAALVWQMIVRLTLAAFLGGLIGLEREIKHKPAGLRTNMFICFGAALFTILSERLAMTYGGDHTRIAAQIIPGIGFIGAGSIIQARGSVVGLTTAATTRESQRRSSRESGSSARGRSSRRAGRLSA